MEDSNEEVIKVYVYSKCHVRIDSFALTDYEILLQNYLWLLFLVCSIPTALSTFPIFSAFRTDERHGDIDQALTPWT